MTLNRRLEMMNKFQEFQEFSNLVENLTVTVDNVGRDADFKSSSVIKELLKKLPEFLRLQWGQHLMQNRIRDANICQFAAWVSEQNEVIATVEIGNDGNWPTNIDFATCVFCCTRVENA
jgi:hypothetical protein